MKKIFLITPLLLILMVSAVKAEEPASKGLGITVGMTYASTYLFRGIDFYSGDGAFLPLISYDVLGSGLIINAAMEHSEDSVFEGKGKGATGHAFNSVDFGAGYTINTAPVSIGLNVWYWDYYNSKDEYGSNASFVTSNVVVTANVLLSPFISFTYDYYIDDKFADPNDKDYYLQFGLSKEFEVIKDAKLKLSAAGGYYNAKSLDAKGVSDVTCTAGMTVAAGPVTYAGSFNYVYIPEGDFRDMKPGDRNKFFATFGTSYTF